jgi:arylsulfatase A-like enzyme
MMTDEYKVIHYLNSRESGVDFEIYDLNSDPEERTDLATKKNTTAEDLKGVLINKLQEVNQTQ